MKNNLIEYKGFYGSVEYSAPDECFFGKIIDIPDLVLFEGDSVSSLKDAFKEMVDDYIIDCEKMGENPLRKYEGSFNIVIPPELHKEVAIIAMKRGISLNDFVQTAIKDKLTKIL